MNDEEDMSEEEMIGKAMNLMVKAFDDYLESCNIDAAYWSKRIVIRFTDSSFTSFIKEMTYDDRGSYEKETE